MTKKIKPSEATLKPVRDTGPALPRVEPARVQEALGAEPAAEGLAEVLAPVTLFTVREELVRRLQSSGGRPGLSGVSRRAKIPLSDQEWLDLEELAAAITSPGARAQCGFAASPGDGLGTAHPSAKESALRPGRS